MQLRNKRILLLPVIIILGIILNIYRYSYDLEKNGRFTIGKIKNIEYKRRGKYTLTYEFYVDGKKYKGSSTVYEFECLKSNQCLEYDFKVVYSIKDPSNSEINLKEFEKYRAGTRFIDINWNNSRD